MTKCSQGFPLATWSLVLSQRQEILNNHLAQDPITPNQEGTIGMRDEVLSNAQDIETSRHQMSDLEDIEFQWEHPDLSMDAVFRPVIDTLFYPFNFWRFWEGFNGSKQTSDWRSTRQGELYFSSASNNSSLRETNPAPYVDEKSPLWNTNCKMCPLKFMKSCLSNLYYHYCVCILSEINLTCFI